MVSPKNPSATAATEFSAGAEANRLLSRFKVSPEEQAKRDQRFADQQRQEAERACQTRLHFIAADLGSRYSPARCSLASYEVYHASQRAVVERLKAFIGKLDAAIQSGAGLVLMGTVGTGKDHLMAAVLYLAAERFSCRWVNGQEVFGRFRDNIDTKQRDEEYLVSLGAPDVLAVSDPIPPVGNLGNWDIGNFYRLIDRRYRASKPTWITINASDEADADRRLSEPVFDRIREGAEIIKCSWPSYRERKHSK